MFGLFSNPITPKQYAQCIIDEIDNYIKTGEQPFLGVVSKYLQSVDQTHKNIIHREIFMLLSAIARFHWIDQQYAVFKVPDNIKAAVHAAFINTIKCQWGNDIVNMYEAACSEYNEPMRFPHFLDHLQ